MSEAGASLTYRLGSRADVPGNNDPRKVTVAVFNLEPELDYVTAPKLEQNCIESPGISGAHGPRHTGSLDRRKGRALDETAERATHVQICLYITDARHVSSVNERTHGHAAQLSTEANTEKATLGLLG